MCYITVGTGIGIGLIINGKTVHGVLHPEAGHVHLPKEEADKDFKGVCPFHGDCVEGLCSNIAIKERLGLKSVDEIPKLADSHFIWDLLAQYCGTLCSNIFLTTSVERIVIGGGIFNRKCLMEKTREVFSKRINGYIVNKKIDDLDSFIARPEHGDDLGMLAAAFAGANH